MTKLFVMISALLFLLPTAFALETVKGAQQDLETFKQSMAVKLEELDRKIEILRSQADQKKDEMVRRAAEDYDRTKRELRAEVERLEADAKGEWKSTKSRLAMSLDELNTKIQRSLKE